MPNLAGIDGCKSGWICIFEEFPSRRLGSKIFPTIADLAKHAGSIDVICIDIPIGLTDAGARVCDIEARKLLGPKRASSVFPAPIRPALNATTYEEACERSFAAQQKKLSRQSWAIYPKIRELDHLLITRLDLRHRIFEVHPEVSFHAWSGGTPIEEPKKSVSGGALRRQLVANHFGPDAFAEVRHRYRKREVADDDIADAFAALWTAERIMNGSSRTLPAHPSHDSEQLPMRMVY